MREGLEAARSFLAVRVALNVTDSSERGGKLKSFFTPDRVGSGRFLDLYETPKTRTSWFPRGLGVQYKFRSKPIRDSYVFLELGVPLRQPHVCHDVQLQPSGRIHGRVHTDCQKLRDRTYRNHAKVLLVISYAVRHHHVGFCKRQPLSMPNLAGANMMIDGPFLPGGFQHV